MLYELLSFSQSDPVLSNVGLTRHQEDDYYTGFVIEKTYKSLFHVLFSLRFFETGISFCVYVSLSPVVSNLTVC